MVAELLIILALVLANGVFSGAEIAVLSVRKTRLKQLLDEGSKKALALKRLRDNPERFLASVQVGITVVGSTAAAFGGASLANRLSPLIARVPALQDNAQQISLGLVIAGVSFLSIVVGELVPKSLALRAAEPYALLIARPMTFVSLLARPAVWLLTQTSNLLLRPLGDRTNFSESRLSADELQLLVEEAGKTGTLDPKSSEIASRALAFGELTAADVMIPRNKIDAIPANATEQTLRQLLLEHGHARMPVYEGTPDHIIGYISANDVLTMVWEKQLVVLHDLIRPAYFIPQTTLATRVLKELQKRHLRMAIVVDEHGGVAGLIALEDLFEELVGDLFDEDETPELLVQKQDDGSALVRGSTPIRDANRLLRIDLPEDGDWTTVGGLVTSLAGGIPSHGTKVTSPDGTVLEVVEATPRTVRAVRVLPRTNEPTH